MIEIEKGSYCINMVLVNKLKMKNIYYSLFRLSCALPPILVEGRQHETAKQPIWLQWRDKSSTHRIGPMCCASCLGMPNQRPAIIIKDQVRFLHLRSFSIWQGREILRHVWSCTTRSLQIDMLTAVRVGWLVLAPIFYWPHVVYDLYITTP